MSKKEYKLLDFKIDLLSIWDIRKMSLKQHRQQQKEVNATYRRMADYIKKVEHRLK